MIKRNYGYKLLFLLFYILIININFGNTINKSMNRNDEEEIINIAVNYFKEKYPDFLFEKEYTYVAQNKKLNKWYVYAFDKRDKGLGYEIYFDNGKISDNFNKKLFEKRLELIKYMNKIMPENKTYNEYVGFNPYGSNNAKTYNKSSAYGGRIEYVVVSKKINFKKQINNDYLILKKSNELLAELGKEASGNTVQYFETNTIDLEEYISKNKEYEKRDLSRSAFNTVYFYERKNDMQIVADYSIGENGRKDDKLKKILESEVSYKKELKSMFLPNVHNINYVNRNILKELLSYIEKEEIKREEETRVSKLKTGEKYVLKYKRDSNGGGEIAYNPNGKNFSYITADSKIIIIADSMSGEIKRAILGPTGGFLDLIVSLSYSPDGKFILAGNYNNKIYMWDVESGKQVKIFGGLLGHWSKVRIVSFTPNGKNIISASEDCKLKIWDIKTGLPFKSMSQNQQYTMCFSPDGKYFIFGNDVYDTKKWKKIKTIKNARYIQMFTPDGKNLISYERGNDEIEIIDFNTEKSIKKIKIKSIEKLVLQHSGKYFVTISFNGIEIWNFLTGEKVNSIQEINSGGVKSVAFSPNDKNLIISWSKMTSCYAIE